MIVLDTNVVSEPLKTDGNVVVQTWLDQQSAETLYLTATSLSELLVGIEILPKGRRKAGLAVALTELMTKLFKNRILPFDERAAIAYAPLVTRARAAGKIISVADGQIAAIAAVHGFAVATRDTTPFVSPVCRLSTRGKVDGWRLPWTYERQYLLTWRDASAQVRWLPKDPETHAVMLAGLVAGHAGRFPPPRSSA